MKTLKTIVVIAALILSAGAGFFVNYYLMNKNEDLNLKTEEEAKKELPYFDLDGVYLDKKNSNNEGNLYQYLFDRNSDCFCLKISE